MEDQLASINLLGSANLSWRSTSSARSRYVFSETALGGDVELRLIFFGFVLGRLLGRLMLRFGLVGVIRRQVPNGLCRFQSGHVQVDEVLKSPSLIAGTAFTIASLAHNLLGLSRL